MRLVKAAKASTHAKFSNLSSGYMGVEAEPPALGNQSSPWRRSPQVLKNAVLGSRTAPVLDLLKISQGHDFFSLPEI